jgi:hypothetical protein
MNRTQTNEAALPALQPHTVLYILPSGHFSGLTKSLKIFTIPSSRLGSNVTLSKSTVETAKKIVASLSPTFTLQRENLTGSRMIYSDASSEIIAEWNVPVLSFGTSELTFPYGSEHSSHAVTIEPLGAVKRGVKLVKDSIVYEWTVDRESDRAVFSLHQVIGKEKVVVGGFLEEGRQAGLIIVDEAEIDAFIAVAGVIAILQRSDSFVK